MRAYIFILISLILTGCASKSVVEPLPLESVDEAWLLQQQAVADIEAWEIQGKFSIKQGQSATNANLNWQQSSLERYEIALSGPLGQGSVLLSGYPNRVILKDAKGKTDSAKSAEELLYKHTKWSIPIESLYYWVRGLPDPHYTFEYALNPQGQLSGLKQHGWTLAYQDYQQYHGYTLPRKITLYHPKTRITLLLRSWQFSQFE